MKKTLSSVLAVTFLSMTLGACYSNHMIAPQELYKLNGFREGQTVILSSVEGDAVKFSSKTQLNVQASDGQAMTAKYSSVAVNGSTMTAVVRGSGAPVNIDLSQVTNATTRQLSVGKTVGLAVGLGVGIPVVLAVTIWVVVFFVFSRAVFGR